MHKGLISLLRKIYHSYYSENYELKLMIGKGGTYKQEESYGILLTGTEEFITKVYDALNMIRLTDSFNWNIVQRNITRITLSYNSGVDVVSGRYTTKDIGKSSAEYMAGSIVHESWHREYFRKGEIYDGKEGEIKCMVHQNIMLEKLGQPAIDIKKMLETEYWEIKYEKRHW